jgi:hypothetical protein
MVHRKRRVVMKVSEFCKSVIDFYDSKNHGPPVTNDDLIGTDLPPFKEEDKIPISDIITIIDISDLEPG